MAVIAENEILISEWDYEKNSKIGLDPYKLTCGSEKMAWWECVLGHSWQAVVHSRNNGTGCPYCAGKKVWPGFNDLRTTHPGIIKEWNYEKNDNILPTQVSAGSGKKVWWICSKGHEWEASIYSRVSGNRCPECNKECRISSSEMKVYYYIHKYFPDALSSYHDKIFKAMELDVFIPSRNIGIEYDGELWHNDTKKDLKKDTICKNNDIKLIRIREPDCPKYDSTCIFVYLQNLYQSHLAETIRMILKELNVKEPDVNFDRDCIEIENIISHTQKEKSLLVTFPDIASEWNTTKNGQLKADDVFPHSHKKVWWKCKKCGHEWRASINKRTEGTKCPKCTNKLSKMVFCQELNQIFKNACDAQTCTGVAQSHISNCCLLKRKSAGKHPDTGEKFHWRFVEDQKIDNKIILGAISLRLVEPYRIKEIIQN